MDGWGVREVLRRHSHLRDEGDVAGVGDLMGTAGKGEPALMRELAGLALDHVGVAVWEIDGVRGFYEGLGLRLDPVQTVAQEGVRVAMIASGRSRIELLEALSEDTVIGRFLAKRGEGMHHVALRVVGIDAVFLRWKEQGVRLVSDAVRVGADGHRYFFVHPSSTGGVLMEMVEGGNGCGSY